jgi:PilZ domain-containing protein
VVWLLDCNEQVDVVMENRADWWLDARSGKAEMGMHAWQALVLLRGEFRNPRVDHPHVQNEELDHFALGTVEGAEGGRIEEHMHHCGACRLRLREAQVFARLLGQMECSPKRGCVHEYRREPRYKVAEPATITVCHPVHSVEIRGAVVNVSRSGCRVRTPEPVYCGADVLILVKSAAFFGTVRSCRTTADGTFDIGLSIDRVVMELDSNAVMDSLKSQPEANGGEEEGLANVTPAQAS